MKSVFDFLGSNLGFLGSSSGLSGGSLGLLGKSAQDIFASWLFGVVRSLSSSEIIIDNVYGFSAGREHEVRVGEDRSLYSILDLNDDVAIGQSDPFGLPSLSIPIGVNGVC